MVEIINSINNKMGNFELHMILKYLGIDGCHVVMPPRGQREHRRNMLGVNPCVD